MGEPPVLAPEQDRALGRLTGVAGLERFYLARGTAVAWHLRHRISRDLDLFSVAAAVDLGDLRERIAAAVPDAEVISVTEAALRLRIEEVPVDFVRYRYPPLEPPVAGPRGFRVAGLRDLAAMKLASIAGRGLRRDFWDLHAILGRSLSLRDAARAYLDRFGPAQPVARPRRCWPAREPATLGAPPIPPVRSGKRGPHREPRRGYGAVVAS